MKSDFKPGDWVIYRKHKTGPSPGPRAQLATPAPKGDDYRYFVEKYWVVQHVHDDGNLTIRTRRGKNHVVDVNDPLLLRPTWWQKLILARRFRAVEESEVDSESADS